jgi:aldehyde dehydrogenase (NAD+)
MLSVKPDLVDMSKVATDGPARFPHFDRNPTENGDVLRRECVGVCGLITPWNWPIDQSVLKVIPALATGCSCVLKPSEFTPLNAMMYAELIHETGFPPRVVDPVNSNGTECSSALPSTSMWMQCLSPDQTARASPSTRMRPTQSSGSRWNSGLNHQICFFADADLEGYASRSIRDCLNNSGQSCDAPTCMLVKRSAHRKVIDIAKRVGEKAKVSDPETEGAHQGPLVSDAQFGGVQALDIMAPPRIGGP